MYLKLLVFKNIKNGLFKPFMGLQATCFFVNFLLLLRVYSCRKQKTFIQPLNSLKKFYFNLCYIQNNFQTLKLVKSLKKSFLPFLFYFFQKRVQFLKICGPYAILGPCMFLIKYEISWNFIQKIFGHPPSGKQDNFILYLGSSRIFFAA